MCYDNGATPHGAGYSCGAPENYKVRGLISKESRDIRFIARTSYLALKSVAPAGFTMGLHTKLAEGVDEVDVIIAGGKRIYTLFPSSGLREAHRIRWNG